MSLFARSFRPATQTLRSVRRYATEAPKGGSSTGLYATLGLVGCGGAGYYFYNQGAAAKAASAPAKPAFTGGDQGFVSLMLKEVEVLTPNTKRFRFDLPDGDHVSGLPITSALITKYKGPEMEKPVIRPYTPVSEDDARGYMDLIVKRYEGGPMSSHIHSMEPGQRLDFKGPIPKYPWSPNKHDHVVMIAGGTGITPMWQLIQKIFSNPDEDRTKVTLLYGNVTEDDIILKKELQHLENQFPQRFKAFYVLDNPPKGWTQGKGFVTKELIKQVSPEPKEENIKFFVCGPPGLYKAISGTKKSPQDQGELDGALKALGYNKDQVFKF